MYKVEYIYGFFFLERETNKRTDLNAASAALLHVNYTFVCNLCTSLYILADRGSNSDAGAAIG